MLRINREPESCFSSSSPPSRRTASYPRAGPGSLHVVTSAQNRRKDRMTERTFPALVFLRLALAPVHFVLLFLSLEPLVCQIHLDSSGTHQQHSSTVDSSKTHLRRRTSSSISSSLLFVRIIDFHLLPSDVKAESLSSVDTGSGGTNSRRRVTRASKITASRSARFGASDSSDSAWGA